MRGNKVFDNRNILNVKKFNKGKYQPCFTRSINLCCKQLKTCSTFQSAFNKSIFLIRHNIPHKDGIEAVKQKLKKSKPSISIKVILTFLKLILTLNNFVFNRINYLPKKGCAMGTKCAPSYANIFMGWFEE